MVRKVIPCTEKEEEQTIHTNLHALMGVNNVGIIQMVRVLEKRGKEFVVDYEYVPESLSRSAKMGESAFLSMVR